MTTIQKLTTLLIKTQQDKRITIVKHPTNLKQMIEQKDMTFDHDFCYSFSFSSSLFFRREEIRGKG